MDLCIFKSIKLRGKKKKTPIQKEKGETQREGQCPKPRLHPKAKATPLVPPSHTQVTKSLSYLLIS
jgi:hypothetical protein